MIVHKLSSDFFEDNFELIAIHTTMEDYRLVYFLNKVLNIRLYKKNMEQNFAVQNNPFSYFHWYDQLSKLGWHCFANRIVFQEKMGEGSLFNTSDVVRYLIDNKKKIDFFLKIDDVDTRFQTKKIIEKITTIPEVFVTYTIDIDTLSSKHKLIFQQC